MKKVIAIVSCMVLSACASGPMYGLAPAPAPSDEQATIYVLRSPSNYGQWMTTDIYIDHRAVAAIPEKTFTWFYVAAGNHEFGAGWTPGLIFLGEKTPDISKEIAFKKGKTYYFSVESVSIPGKIIEGFRLIPKEQAESVLKDYRYREAHLN